MSGGIYPSEGSFRKSVPAAGSLSCALTTYAGGQVKMISGVSRKIQVTGGVHAALFAIVT